MSDFNQTLKMKHTILFLLLIVLTLHASAQQIDFYNLDEEQLYNPDRDYNTWSVTAGIGPVIYYTDVVDYTIFPANNWRFGPSFLVSKQFGRPWSIDAQYLMADMYGEKNSRFFPVIFMI
jgi:hypothetical protein